MGEGGGESGVGNVCQAGGELAGVGAEPGFEAVFQSVAVGVVGEILVGGGQAEVADPGAEGLQGGGVEVPKISNSLQVIRLLFPSGLTSPVMRTYCTPLVSVPESPVTVTLVDPAPFPRGVIRRDQRAKVGGCQAAVCSVPSDLKIIWLKLVVIQPLMVRLEVLPLSRIPRANPGRSSAACCTRWHQQQSNKR
jgi:hypothetical protein